MTTLLDTDKPVTYGPIDLQDFYFEHKRQQAHAVKNAMEIIPSIMEEFNKVFSCDHKVVEEYMMDDAEAAIVVMSSTAGTAKSVVDDLRAKGIKAGLVKPCLFRPFPKEYIIKALSKSKIAAVLDRAESFSGCGGPLFSEIKSAMYDSKNKPDLLNYIFGLGGRDIFPKDIEAVYQEMFDILRTGNTCKQVNYIGVRE
jgi:pyruvate ferredoxin oxidoreductase alpha subunit